MEDKLVFIFLDEETKLNIAIQTLQNKGCVCNDAFLGLF